MVTIVAPSARAANFMSDSGTSSIAALLLQDRTGPHQRCLSGREKFAPDAATASAISFNALRSVQQIPQAQPVLEIHILI